MCRSRWDHQSEALLMESLPLLRRRHQHSLCHVRTQQEGSHPQAKNKASPELNKLTPWFWTFQPPGLWKVNVCCLKQKHFFFNYFWKDGDSGQNSNGWPVMLSIFDYFIIKCLIIQIHKYVLLCTFTILRLVKCK